VDAVLALEDRHRLGVPLADNCEDTVIVAQGLIEEERRIEGVAHAVSDDDTLEL